MSIFTPYLLADYAGKAHKVVEIKFEAGDNPNLGSRAKGLAFLVIQVDEGKMLRNELVVVDSLFPLDWGVE
jgi:hypothetical protein